MARRPKILYAGTYERAYPRNRQFIRLLTGCGCDVVELHEPFWEHYRDKSRGFGGRSTVVSLSIALTFIYLRLLVRMVSNLRQADVVVIGYIGQLDMLVLGSVARIARKPVLFNPLVTLTDTVVEDRVMTPTSSMKARLIWLIDWISLRLATVTVADTEQNARYLTERFGLAPSRVHAVHVGADEDVFRPSGSRRDQPGALHVLFYGKMIPLHGVDTILDAIAELKSAGETEISFEIIGSGQDESRVRDFLDSNPDMGVIYRPWVAFQRLPQRIASADVVLGIFGDTEKAARVIPNKVFQAMSVGSPIVTRDSPAARSVLRAEESALLVPPADPSALANALRVLKDPDCRRNLAARSREAFERHASDNVLQRTVREILCDLVPELKLADSAGRCK